MQNCAFCSHRYASKNRFVPPFFGFLRVIALKTPGRSTFSHSSRKLTEGLDALLARLDAALAGRVRRIAVLLPYDKLGEATPMRENGTVLTEEYRPEGVYLEGIVKTMDLHRFTPYLV